MKQIRLIKKKEKMYTLIGCKDYLRKEKTLGDLKGKFRCEMLIETSFPIYLQNLIKIPAHSQDINHFINQCKIRYQENPKALEFLHEFEEYYEPETAIFWYTREGFLFRLVNKALRHQDVDSIYLLHFFIADLFNQISLQGLTKDVSTCLLCYRGQLISKDELDKLEKERCFCAYGFISASKNKNIAEIFSGYKNENDNGLEHAIFKIEVPENAWKTGCVADISKQSYNENEEEILFAAGTLFEKRSVSFDEADQTWYIWLRMHSGNVRPSTYAYIQYCPINMRLSELDLLLYKEINRVYLKQDIYGDEFRNIYKILLTDLSSKHDEIKLCSCEDSANSYELILLPTFSSRHCLINDPRTMIAAYDCLGIINYYEKKNFNLALQYFNRAAELENNAIINEQYSQRRYFYMACIYKIQAKFELAWDMCKTILKKLDRWDYPVMNAIIYAPLYKTKCYTYETNEYMNFKELLDYASVDLHKYWQNILTMYRRLHKDYKRQRLFSKQSAWSCSNKAIEILIKYKPDDFNTLLSEYYKFYLYTSVNFAKCDYEAQSLHVVEKDIEKLPFTYPIPYSIECSKKYFSPLPEGPPRNISWFYEYIGNWFALKEQFHEAKKWWTIAHQLWDRDFQLSSHAARCQFKISYPRYFWESHERAKLSIEW